MLNEARCPVCGKTATHRTSSQFNHYYSDAAGHAWAYHVVTGSKPVLYCMHQCNEDRQAYHMVLDNIYYCNGIPVTIPDIIFPEIEALHELQEALRCST